MRKRGDNKQRERIERRQLNRGADREQRQAQRHAAAIARATHRSTPVTIPLDVFEDIVRYCDGKTLSSLASTCHFISACVAKEVQWREANVPHVPRAYLRMYEEDYEFGDATFPRPRGIQINMMPFHLEDAAGTIPAECHGYLAFIRQCVGRSTGLAYLTIDEREVPIGESHRRGGLHIDSPTVWEELLDSEPGDAGKRFKPYALRWGFGVGRRSHRDGPWGQFEMIDGGIFFASSSAGTTRVYPNLILNPAMVDAHGSIKGYRHLLGDPIELDAGEVCWITDKTPHESLPLRRKRPGQKFSFRQFFRLVTGPVDVWFSKHNTPSPFGVLPDCVVTDVDKFEVVARGDGKRTLYSEIVNYS
ncbi:hypothetical protein M427DRAFT_53930 [Gonapodya prolifera JEL478]|uniref:F-box domain-containing protein n=1 Tax=Gonapodya prolifera (strain JEL478) TaxID=1344416 RepID=A0A139AMU8_GONPJ|nr:hypothetical protein M427DRAFT_53930 [Gonapodya prolifera JEL478]|eukprot:KXS18082.1 hypothetical protein M427DRAFT_53930 [Gonapodya prolifera JEL478]